MRKAWKKVSKQQSPLDMEEYSTHYWLLGYWVLRCDSLHLCLQYFYDTKITQLTEKEER